MPASHLNNVQEMRIPILTYHQLDRPPARRVPYRCLVTAPAVFRRHMQMLKALGYQGLSIDALVPYLRGERHGKVVGITFDDGYVNTFRHALPVLSSLGFSATSYIVSGEIGGSNHWDRVERVPPQPLVDAAQLREWVAAGQDVGAHTHSHVELAHTAPATARAEIARSREELQQLLGREVRHFCYPYGRYSAGHVAMVRELGFATATSTRDAGVTARDSLHELPRHTMMLHHSWLALWLRVATDRYDEHLPGAPGIGSPSMAGSAGLHTAGLLGPE